MRVCVVGSGVSGLAAAWALAAHSPHEVTLLEADDRPGGHANTFALPSGEVVDTGFIVLNPVTYPNFLRFLKEVGIAPLDSDMSFSLSRDGGKYEWAGTTLQALFATDGVKSATQWRMLWDIIRFNTDAVALLKEGGDELELPLHQVLRRRGYSKAFTDNYLLPMTAAIWSTPVGTAALSFPTRTLLNFMHNHHLLQLFSRPQWLTLPGGSRTYVSKATEQLGARFETGRKVTAVRREGKVVKVSIEGQQEREFDHVVMATHADDTVRIIGSGITPEEQGVLQHFAYSENTAVLHTDASLMPRRRNCWAAWNYLSFSAPATLPGDAEDVNAVSLTYWMNALQPWLSSASLGFISPAPGSSEEEQRRGIFVTLNPPSSPAKNKTIASYSYRHPLFTPATAAAQLQLPSIQGTGAGGISYAGAWAKYGFHEDGFTSGLRAALQVGGVELPWEVQDAKRTHEVSAYKQRALGLAEGVRRVGSWVLFGALERWNGTKKVE